MELLTIGHGTADADELTRLTAYNHEHRHCGIGRTHTPVSVQFGAATEVRAQRHATLDRAPAHGIPSGSAADPTA